MGNLFHQKSKREKPFCFFKNLFFILFFFFSLFKIKTVLAFEVKQTYPRLANYFLNWTISNQEAEVLARWDILILDPEVPYRSPNAIAQIRDFNPKIIILAYFPVAEIINNWAQLKEVAPFRYKLGRQIPEEWYLKDASGNYRTFWPGTKILNLTEKCPLVNGQRWLDFLPQFVNEEILKKDFWDGVFYDNSWDSLTYFAGKNLDLNRDGQPEKEEIADKLWQEGLKKIYRETRRLASNKLVILNSGVIYASEADGVMIENFSRQSDWLKIVNQLKKIKTQSRQGISILNTNTQNQEKPNDFSTMRFGLSTALLFNSFYSFDFGDKHHGQTWWYDEYEVYLGVPLGEAKRVEKELSLNLWRRDFQNGVVFLNPTEKTIRYNLSEEFEKLRGKQDPIFNDGMIVSEIALPAKEGVILRRPLKEINDIPYLNGVFVRVFNEQGENIRAGFFAYHSKYPPRARLAFVDLDGDGKREVIVAQKGVIQIRKTKETTFIVPFGQYQGELSWAVGDVNGDGIKEIVVTAAKEKGGEIRVYRPNGDLIAFPWRAFGASYQGGANVAVGDLNGDGFSEVIVGAGEGGGPQIRVFSYQGKLLSAGFFAYDPRFRGGVRLAVGDINGDGQDEIVTGLGPGGPPQIRIFDGRGKMIQAGFFAFEEKGNQGVEPLVTDLDGDGKMEILATTREIFY